MDPAVTGPDFSLAVPGRTPLVLTSQEVHYLVAYLLDELDQPDSAAIDETAQKINAYLIHIKE